jgi:GNAT superfamily N-acetyltransferase
MELARPAHDSDLAACRRLLDDLLSEVHALRGGTALVGTATPDSLLERWTGREAQLFAGEFEGVVVGVLGVTAPGPEERGRGRIECCYVERDARGVGVGTALMQAAVAWCRDAGCREVDAFALPGDRATKQRLEAEGFTARLLTLSLRLD